MPVEPARGMASGVCAAASGGAVCHRTGVHLPDDDPVHDDELDRLFAGLARFATVIAAVSGGADSTALAHLLRCWIEARDDRGLAAPAIVVATVDHGLRPGSAEEARQVAALAARLGFRCELAKWGAPRPSTGIQEAARAARYRLLADIARRHPGPAVVTAHTRDDQAETVLMRLARGSGLDGLAAMRAEVPLADVIGAAGADIALVRPLLAMPRSRLVATLRTAGEPWIEDPSNANPAFERVRLRHAAPALIEAGLGASALALTARRLARAAAALDAMTEDLWRRLVQTNNGAFAELPVAALAAEPAELRIRLAQRLLGAAGGTGTPASLEKAERLDAWLFGSDGATARQRARTIAGCRVTVDRGRVLAAREWGRRGLPTVTVADGETAVWDGRFIVDATRSTAGGPWRVAALGEAGAGAIDEARRRRRLPWWITRTLPGIHRGDRLVAAPHLGIAVEPSAVVLAPLDTGGGDVVLQSGRSG